MTSPWGSHLNAATSNDYTYAPNAHSNLSPRMLAPPSLSPQQRRGGDVCGDELFGGFRRRRGVGHPSFSDSPIIDEETRFNNRFKAPPAEHDLDWAPYLDKSRPPPPGLISREWRYGDERPLALDGSPRGPRQIPSARLVRDPEISGGGYAGEHVPETVYHEPPKSTAAQAEALDIHTARWRMGDPNPFTLGGEMPQASPRRANVALRQRSGDAGVGGSGVVGVEVGDDSPFYAALTPRPRPNLPNLADPEVYRPTPTDRWRTGESDGVGFVFGDAHSGPNAKPNPIYDMAWRRLPADGLSAEIGLTTDYGAVHAMGGRGPRRPPAYGPLSQSRGLGLRAGE